MLIDIELKENLVTKTIEIQFKTDSMLYFFELNHLYLFCYSITLERTGTKILYK